MFNLNCSQSSYLSSLQTIHFICLNVTLKSIFNRYYVWPMTARCWQLIWWYFLCFLLLFLISVKANTIIQFIHINNKLWYEWTKRWMELSRSVKSKIVVYKIKTHNVPTCLYPKSVNKYNELCTEIAFVFVHL